jgi:hypothetical protein
MGAPRDLTRGLLAPLPCLVGVPQHQRGSRAHPPLTLTAPQQQQHQQQQRVLQPPEL